MAGNSNACGHTGTLSQSVRWIQGYLLEGNPPRHPPIVCVIEGYGSLPTEPPIIGPHLLGHVFSLLNVVSKYEGPLMDVGEEYISLKRDALKQRGQRIRLKSPWQTSLYPASQAAMETPSPCS